MEELQTLGLTFDLILLVDVFEHLPDPDHHIELIYKYLKQGGHLLIQVPYREDLSVYLKPDYPYPYVHLWSFDEYQLEILFTRLNKFSLLKTLYTVYTGSFPSKWIKNRNSIFAKVQEKIYKILKSKSQNTYYKISRRFNTPLEILMLFKK